MACSLLVNYYVLFYYEFHHLVIIFGHELYLLGISKRKPTLQFQYRYTLVEWYSFSLSSQLKLPDAGYRPSRLYLSPRITNDIDLRVYFCGIQLSVTFFNHGRLRKSASGIIKEFFQLEFNSFKLKYHHGTS